MYLLHVVCHILVVCSYMNIVGVYVTCVIMCLLCTGSIHGHCVVMCLCALAAYMVTCVVLHICYVLAECMVMCGHVYLLCTAV